jgi:hypothetical protein
VELIGLRISSVASGCQCGTLANFALASLAACLAHGCTGESTTGLALPDLAAHQWKHRVLIIDTPSMQAAPYLQQIRKRMQTSIHGCTRRSNSRTSRRAVSVEHFANFAYFEVERNPSNPFSIRLMTRR